MDQLYVRNFRHVGVIWDAWIKSFDSYVWITNHHQNDVIINVIIINYDAHAIKSTKKSVNNRIDMIFIIIFPSIKSLKRDMNEL